MKCAILQPSYLPWRGYFDLIQRVDTFVFYDSVQYDKHGWRNRNRIKTANGPVWLTVPVVSKGNVAEGLLIKDVPIQNEKPWARKQLGTIRQAYGRAPFFDRYMPLVEEFLAEPPDLLAELTIPTTVALAKELGIERTFLRSSEIGIDGERTDRLIAILQKLGATRYISGPSARSYLEEDRLTEVGISIEWMEYDYPEYEQLHPPYEQSVSILDPLFMKGPEAAGLIP